MLGTAVLLPAASAVGSAAHTGVAPGRTGVTANPSTPVDDCARDAAADDIAAWVCVGSVRIYPAAGRSKEEIGEELAAAATQTGAATSSKAGRTAAQTEGTVSAAAADDYDGWCENGSICRRNITRYIHETKGNAAYGNQDGAIGSFDMILHVELNGRSPRLKGVWDWDSGPALAFTGVRIQCREEQFGPNPNCGTYAPDPNENGAFNISRSDTRDTGRLINGKPVEDDGTYYAEIVGYFTPTGYPRYTISALHSGQWTCRRSRTPDCNF
jgi:hypothetical protein